MPRLVRLYIRHVAIGFGLGAVFVAALMWLNVGNLWHLVSTSDMGWIALAMLVFANGTVFAGVQFAITIMRMEESDDTPAGGRRAPVATDIPARVEAVVSKRRAPAPLR